MKSTAELYQLVRAGLIKVLEEVEAKADEVKTAQSRAIDRQEGHGAFNAAVDAVAQFRSELQRGSGVGEMNMYIRLTGEAEGDLGTLPKFNMYAYLLVSTPPEE